MKREFSQIPTRESLLSRLKDWNDQAGWKDFFDTYWKLIYGAAISAGLNDAEAQDVVQETVISVMKSMPGFTYDRNRGSFKAWLLQLTRWRIRDQFRVTNRIRDRQDSGADFECPDHPVLIEDIADPATPALERYWEAEWDSNLFEAAIDQLKQKVDPRMFQIYDLLLVKKHSASEVSRIMGVNVGYVYVTKFRLNKILREELNCLKTKYR